MSVAASTPEAWATLSLKALPHTALVALLRAFGGPEAVLAATRAQLRAVVPDDIAARVQQAVDQDALAATRAWLADPAHEIIAWDDADYPRALLELGFAPPALYFVGRRELLNRPALAIVGSRSASAQGALNARAFAQGTLPSGPDDRVGSGGRRRRCRARRRAGRTRARRSPSSAPVSTACIRRAIASLRIASPGTAD